MMTIPKIENESINEYIVRVGSQRNILGIAWCDLAKYVNDQYHTALSKDSVRSRYRKNLRKYPIEENIVQKIADVSEINKINAEKLQLLNYYKTISREDTLKSIATETARVIAESYPFKELEPVYGDDRRLNKGILLLGDWHYGMTIDAPCNHYSPEICKDRVQRLLNTVIDYTTFYNIQELYVINLGDMISGNIHLPIRINSQKDVITQTLEVSELIAQFLSALLRNKLIIKYYSTLDNHSRIDPNRKDSIQLETLARITPWFLKERFKDANNISIFDNDKYYKDIVSFKINNFDVLAVHGDKDKPPQIVDRLTAFTGKHQDLICLAHYHHFNCDEQNRTMIVSNGTLMGTDEFAIDLRLDSEPSQTLIVLDNRNVCKHICKINVDSVNDD